MTQLTDTGLVVSRLVDRINELTASIQSIFGPSIDLDPDTIDGQTLGIFAESINNLDMLLGQLYGCLNPSNASGAVLSAMVQWNGITRKTPSYSTDVLTLGGTYKTLVPAGSLFHNTMSQAIFASDADATIPQAGVVNVPVTCTVIGAQVAPAGMTTAIDTPVFGLQTCTNAADAIVGAPIEQDGALRTRRAQSTAYPSQTINDGIYAGIANISGVTDLQVYENDQPTPNPTTGQAANSIYAVVEGGANQDIWNTLLLKKTAGIPTLGSVNGSANDSQGNPKFVNFDRPTYINIYVTVNGTQRPGWPTDGDTQIQNAIVNWAQGFTDPDNPDNDIPAHYTIGEEVIQSDIYSPIAPIPGKSITSIFIGTAPNPTTSANVQILYNQKARYLLTNVVVNI